LNNRAGKWIGIGLLVLLVNAGYLAAFASPNVFYMSNVLLHVALGAVLAVAALWFAKEAPMAVGSFLGSFLAGTYLTWKGSLIELRPVLWAHIAAGVLAAAFLIPWVWKKASPGFRTAFQAACILMIGLPLATMAYRKASPDPLDRITNAITVPTDMAGEGGGPHSPFFPSSAKTNVGGIIPSNFFMDSATCGECHKQIYTEWKSSVHHFASFNNQFYRKAIEYMQDVEGPQPSKWCAGCHDHAVFFNGRFDHPIKEQIDTPEAQAGLACTSCHAITHVDSTMGNGGYTIEYPALHQLMTSKNKAVRTMVDFMTYLDPEPHRRTFLKPFMKSNASEFCSTCHKVHLDVPVNNYRWFRGFNDYDNWQASGFGYGARSFYYPPKGQTCTDCHMPLVPSTEAGNRNGQIHSHTFAAANMAVPFVNDDQKQMEATKKFLTSGFITVDIFAAAPVEEKNGTRMVRRAATGPQVMSGIAAGEESDQPGDTFIREVGKVAAPIDKANLQLAPGSTTRVDVVVRTRKIGHSFPGGTIDAFDIWVELAAVDAAGKTVFWSGQVEDDGKGDVEPGAHFYRALQLDGAGNPIDKRNAWQARSALYAHQIPPGAADSVHYLLRIPKDAKGPITLTAKLNYRKFSRFYTEFAFAGQPKPGQDPALLDKEHNSLEYSFDKANIPANVSSKLKGEIPDLPIIVLAKAEAKIGITNNPAATQWNQVATKADRERWNDWGIGMLLQGDLKGAEYAFTKVTQAEPSYADGWLNVARTLIQEGETGAAQPFIQKSLAIDPAAGRTYYFKALIEKVNGDYAGALKSLAVTTSKYPRDRVVWNQVGRILFLQRKYREAVDVLKKAYAVDPEDLQTHYTMMLAYRGLGDTAAAEREEKLFLRFKAEESSQSITAIRRRMSPEDNNEQQRIHDHESVVLSGKAAAHGGF
jgi:tetratricopeptide (TPR) repeat protein